MGQAMGGLMSTTGWPGGEPNLKGIFFEDDNMEHMAFSVEGRWGERGVTTIRITELGDVLGSYFATTGAQNHEL